ncbi:hypothetical protein JTE90_023132 [Oedothorax gibbosus]|uniref:Uncharacterized protein n=1 Tax=Oedothorax gibbosus TaxID=931172 RepID=A0AAV6TI23_9ARAC|nr:hypothetical protein JTE90_023132 [Oedothorax gibbosus]
MDRAGINVFFARGAKRAQSKILGKHMGSAVEERIPMTIEVFALKPRGGCAPFCPGLGSGGWACHTSYWNRDHTKCPPRKKDAFWDNDSFIFPMVSFKA